MEKEIVYCKNTHLAEKFTATVCQSSKSKVQYDHNKFLFILLDRKKNGSRSAKGIFGKDAINNHQVIDLMVSS